jgi:PAS domain S-box-containing protein
VHLAGLAEGARVTGPLWSTLLTVLIAFVLLLSTWLAARATASARDVVRLQHTLAALAATTHDWLWSTDRHGRLTYSNSGSTLLGYLPDELMGREAYELIDPVGLAEWRARVSELGRGGSGWSDVTLHMRHRDGHLVDIECSAAPIPGRDGRMVGFEGSARPLSADVALATTRARQRRRVEQILTDRAVRIAFQPIVSLTSGSVVGVEALARIDSGAGLPYQPPDVWLRDASDVGLGVSLELQALRSALDSVALLPAGLYVSINASPRTIADPAFLELLLSHDTPLDRLVLEITEHESVADYEPLTNTLSFARSRGLRLAVDDAGSGYASFRHILTLRPDYIKLDRDLTAGIDTDAARRALASAVVMFALELDAEVTAEGVETAGELDTLCSLSVDAAQGYYLARPSTEPEDWSRWSGPTLRLVGHEHPLARFG